MVDQLVTALVFLLVLGGPFVLYYLVRSEHDTRERMDRRAAEKQARRDTRDPEYERKRK